MVSYSGYHDGSVKKIYVNGILDASGAQDGLYAADPNAALIGQHIAKQSNLQFYGSIDEVRVWDVARTQEEIVATMNNKVAPGTPHLTAYFPLDEGTGTTTLNAAVPASSGTLINGPVWVTPSTAPFNYSYLWSTGSTSRSIDVTQAVRIRSR